MNWVKALIFLVCGMSIFLVCAGYCASYIIMRYRTYIVPPSGTPLPSRERFCVEGVHGAQLACWYMATQESSCKGVVIASHGIADSKNGIAPYITHFLVRGYDCVVYDLRHHNESSGAYCTLGGHETDDLVAITRYVRQHYAAARPVYYWGFSLGATISLCAAAICGDIAGVAAQAPFVSIRQVLRHYMWKFYRLPPWPTVNVACFFLRQRTGIRCDAIDVRRCALALARTPVFVYGSCDDRQVPARWLRTIAETIGHVAQVEEGPYGHMDMCEMPNGAPVRGVVRAARFFDECGNKDL